MLPSWIGRGGCVVDRRGAGCGDGDWEIEMACVCGDADGPKVAVIVAWNVLLSGVDASGVSVIVSVVDCPTASETGASPVSVKPDDSVSANVMLFSATLPAFVIVIVSSTPSPGIVLTAVGPAVTVTASMLGTVNVSVWVWVIDGLVVLVAVTVNESWAPGAGSGWPAFGIKYMPTIPVSPAGTVSLVSLLTIEKPLGTFENVRL